MGATRLSVLTRKAPKTAWKPGVSGNPGGRPSPQRMSLTEACRVHTKEAVEALGASLSDPKVRVPAAVALLDRGWGRPKQQIEATGDGSMALHLLAAQTVSGELLAALNEHRVIEGRAEPANGQADGDLSSYPPALE